MPHLSRAVTKLIRYLKWLNKNGETHINGYDFKKRPRLDKDNNAITLSNDEYENLFRAIHCYRAKQNKLDALELRMRQILQHYVLIAANSG